jgi:hypothetical protein
MNGKYPMLDLLLIKITEHALRALNPPKAGAFFVEIKFDGNHRLFKYDRHPIMYYYEESELIICFPKGTTETYISISPIPSINFNEAYNVEEFNRSDIINLGILYD